MNREKAIEIFKRLKENAPNEMHSETVGTAQELFDMAIQALSQEPCDDAISRQAVINAIENDCMKGGLGSCFACYNDAQAFRGEIEKLPSVTQKSGKWILAEERLPEDIQQRVLVYGQRYFVPDHVEDVDHYADYGLGQYSKEYECWFSDIQDIIAWMPLPEPYKVEPQESEEQTDAT